MAESTHAARSAAAWRLARAQHWVLTRADLDALKFSDAAVEHRVATGRLHPVGRGIYAVGRAELTPRGKWMAAVLACGGGAVLSHRSAAVLWGIGYEKKGRIDVTIRRRSRLERAGVRVHCRPMMPERSV